MKTIETQHDTILDDIIVKRGFSEYFHQETKRRLWTLGGKL